MKFFSILTLSLVMVLPGQTNAQEASTDTLPAFLVNAQVANDVVSLADASNVRGKGGFGQEAGYWIQNGTTVGTIYQFEGLIGAYTYVDGNGLETTGQFGGLSGKVNTDGGLNWNIQGKTFEIDSSFSGEFVFDFTQHYNPPVHKWGK